MYSENLPKVTQLVHIRAGFESRLSGSEVQALKHSFTNSHQCFVGKLQ